MVQTPIRYMRDTPEMIGGLIDLILTIPEADRGSMVEVGCFQGESTSLFALGFKVVHAVDPWETNDYSHHGCPEPMLLQGHTMFNHRRRLLPNIVKHQAASPAAADIFPDKSLQFVYIDADHLLEPVKADIRAWLPKIVDGGWIGGHDYVASITGCFEVAPAVHAFFPPERVMPFKDSSWLVSLK